MNDEHALNIYCSIFGNYDRNQAAYIASEIKRVAAEPDEVKAAKIIEWWGGWGADGYQGMTLNDAVHSIQNMARGLK